MGDARPQANNVTEETATTTFVPETRPETHAGERRKSIAIVFGCTLLGAAAQVLIKLGANQLPQSPLSARLWAMATSFHIVSGYTLYGLFTLLFIYALKREELSIVYPIISLTYVWVTALSLVLFGETLNVFKVLGILTIVAGVGVLGKNGNSQ